MTKSPSTLATLFNHMWSRIVAGIFIPVGNHYFQALASTLQFVAQVCDKLWLVPATDRAFAYITYMSPPHVALVCSGPPQCAAKCGWTKWPVCSGSNINPLRGRRCTPGFDEGGGGELPSTAVAGGARRPFFAAHPTHSGKQSVDTKRAETGFRYRLPILYCRAQHYSQCF